MFCDQSRLGHFAVTRDALAAGRPAALFKVLVAATMFQRRQDAQIMRVLRGIGREDARELTSSTRLLRRADETACGSLASNHVLLTSCDLAKDPQTKLGTCGKNPGVECRLKTHTVLLKRYGHFGKVPTSAALMLRDSGSRDLAHLYRRILREEPDPHQRALALQDTISSAWRVSEKIAAMFLSAVSNPDLTLGVAPWSEGIDWRYFIVVDSNVDLFLSETGYPGPWTYRARREFIAALARRVDPSVTKSELHAYNPRVVQQAIYLFMSQSNRRGAAEDCAHQAPTSCAVCPRALRSLCAFGSP